MTGWEAARRAALARARYRCQIGPVLAEGRNVAYRACTGTATQVHHRQPRGMGGGGPDANRPENLLAACSPCHEWVERNRTAAYRLGLLVRHGPVS